MSRVAKAPVNIPAGVEVKLNGQLLTVKGKNGELSRIIHNEVEVKQEDGALTFAPRNESKGANAQSGTARARVNAMVIGVTDGFTKKLRLVGVGYRAQKQGKKLVLSLGYSHPVEMEDPEGLESTVDGNKIVVKGIDKEKVGQYAAEIRDKRRPEPYKGKGIKYADEVIRRKVGKTGKK